MFTDQASYDIRCEWGPTGVEALAGSFTYIIVDVLSFSTCVAIATQRRSFIIPCAEKGLAAQEMARRHDALLAAPRGEGYSLSPDSWQSAPPDLRVVLPSPNGAVLSLKAAGHGHVLAGCLRNRTAVAAHAAALGGPIAIIPAGERWKDGTLRPSLEDLVGAGAIIALLPGKRSPEAMMAESAWKSVEHDLSSTIRLCSSGRELIERGFAEDLEQAAKLDEDKVAPQLIDGMFRAVD